VLKNGLRKRSVLTKKQKESRQRRNLVTDRQYIRKVTSIILGTGMKRRMRDAQFAKVKLEKYDILAIKCKSCCKNLASNFLACKVFEQLKKNTFD
jgi:hypothetical protein